MVSEIITIINPQGFHMRPANEFASKMAAFSADITLISGSKEANGKSLMSIMAAGFTFGTEIEIRCDGADETEMLASAAALIKSGFGET